MVSLAHRSMSESRHSLDNRRVIYRCLCGLVDRHYQVPNGADVAISNRGILSPPNVFSVPRSGVRSFRQSRHRYRCNIADLVAHDLFRTVKLNGGVAISAYIVSWCKNEGDKAAQGWARSRRGRGVSAKTHMTSCQTPLAP